MDVRQVPNHDAPESYTAYAAVARMLLAGNDGGAVAGLKETGLSVHFDDGEVLHFDLEGRLTRIARPNLSWRRGLSGRMLQVRRRKGNEGGGLERSHIVPRQADKLVEAAHQRMLACLQAVAAGSLESGSACGKAPQLEDQLLAVLERAARFDLQAARRDLFDFRALYHDIPILPPDQYTSLVLLASDGCRYNKCTFCNFYRDVSFRDRPLDEFREHVEQAVRYHGCALAGRRQIFLGQANALLGTPAWRQDILRLVNERFDLPSPDAKRPDARWWKGSVTRFSGITSFLDAFVGARIDAGEFAAMRRWNLKHVYIGMESGSAPLLAWLRKPSEPDRMVETVRAAREGGVAVGVIVLVGAGGERFFDTHVQETIRVIHEMRLGTGDFIYLSPLVPAPGAEYDDLARADGIEPLTLPRMAEQERLLRAGIAASPRQQGPYIAHYEVDHFVY